MTCEYKYNYIIYSFIGMFPCCYNINIILELHSNQKKLNLERKLLFAQQRCSYVIQKKKQENLGTKPYIWY